MYPRYTLQRFFYSWKIIQLDMYVDSLIIIRDNQCQKKEDKLWHD
jgi:hypothetical protein